MDYAMVYYSNNISRSHECTTSTSTEIQNNIRNNKENENQTREK